MTLSVMWVIDGLWVGGTERSLAELLAPLAREGVRSMVVCLRRCGAEGVEQEVLDAGFDVRFLPAGSWPARIAALRRLIRAERPEVVHTALFKANLAGRLAAVGLPTVVVGSLVNAPYGPERRVAEPRLVPWRLWLARQLEAWSARLLCHHFHAVSAAAKAAAARDLGLAPERITVIERGRDPARLGGPSAERRRRARAALGLAEEAEVVLNVGRQDPQKGQRFLLEAIARLVSARPRLVLLVAGRRGTSSDELEALRDQLGLGEKVRFLGHRDDVPELLAAADVFAFPSLFEGLPGAVIEAMALGLPVVAARIPPLYEVVEEGHSALLVDPTSPIELAAAMARVLEDAVFARALGERGAEIFTERFTLERSARRMAELYRRLVEQR